MEKDFLNVSPDSGRGNSTITVTAEPNATFKSRTSTLRAASSGVTKAISVQQMGSPIFGSLSIGVHTEEQPPIMTSSTSFSVNGSGVLTETRDITIEFSSCNFNLYFDILVNKKIIDSATQPDAIVDVSGTGVTPSTNYASPTSVSGSEYYKFSYNSNWDVNVRNDSATFNFIFSINSGGKVTLLKYIINASQW